MLWVFCRLVVPELTSEDGTDEQSAGKRFDVEHGRAMDAEWYIRLLGCHRDVHSAGIESWDKACENVGFPYALLVAVVPACRNGEETDATCILHLEL